MSPPMTQPDLARLEGLVAEASPLPWAYRPQEHDDWGTIRSTVPNDAGWYPVAANGRGGFGADFDEHRRNGTDPYGPNSDLIVAAINSLPALLARVRELEKERDAFRTQAINRGWNWRMCDAYGREEYERQIANEIDRTHEIMLGKKTLEQTFHDDAALTLNRSETDAG